MNRASDGFQLDAQRGYFRCEGVDIMAFDDIYPEGHQAGVSLLMHGRRLMTNGDVRFEPTPGQWQPVPRQLGRTVDPEANAIVTRLAYPDPARHAAGFNPMIYPDYAFSYAVAVRSLGASVEVTVSLDEPLPESLKGLLFFNMELFPGAFFDRPWLMDERSGIFPRQPNGPVLSRQTALERAGMRPVPEGSRPMVERLMARGEYNPMTADSLIALPCAEGRRFTACPDDPLRCFTVESDGAPLRLFDGRMNHNNGWFVLSGEIPCGRTENALRWILTPRVQAGWRAAPVVQVSQVGYHPLQEKIAVLELDGSDDRTDEAELLRVTAEGVRPALRARPEPWGAFLRYRYLRFDFSAVREEGLYKIRYGGSESGPFRIARDIYERGVWQPVLEYFLPVQMCHMRVSEKYRVWHDRCHMDDARMAPVNWNHIDGYVQGPSTLTKYAPGEPVPGLNQGGWHDAGDYDLRVESQAGECYILALTYECFGVDYDATTVDQARKITEIHQPDGENDILQQIEHGLLSVVGGYRALGRLYRGIICSRLRQYVLLGDGASMTDGVPGTDDDRWVFTEDNPARELTTAAELAAAARAMRGFRDDLARDALDAARALFAQTAAKDDAAARARLHAATELFLATGEAEYRACLLAGQDVIRAQIRALGWIACRAARALNDASFTASLRAALSPLRDELAAQCAETPYGVPYRPYIWGAGWGIQTFAMEYYFLHRAFPDLFEQQLIHRALHFILGCHPGSNTASFASGVGASSATTAYGANRADWSYIPGGVVSGTALIRPDFPELLAFPYLWQQTEYVLGGGSSRFMFLVLAARALLNE